MRKTQWQRDAMDRDQIRAAAMEELRRRVSGTQGVNVGDNVQWIDVDGFEARGEVLALHDQTIEIRVTWHEPGTIPQGRDMRLGVQCVAYDRIDD